MDLHRAKVDIIRREFETRKRQILWSQQPHPERPLADPAVLLVELTPVWEDHPYASRIMFIDMENFEATFASIFEKDGNLWKSLYTVVKAPQICRAGRPRKRRAS